MTVVVFVSGEITTEGYVDIPSVVLRNTGGMEVGYTDARFRAATATPVA